MVVVGRVRKMSNGSSKDLELAVSQRLKNTKGFRIGVILVLLALVASNVLSWALYFQRGDAIDILSDAYEVQREQARICATNPRDPICDRPVAPPAEDLVDEGDNVVDGAEIQQDEFQEREIQEREIQEDERQQPEIQEQERQDRELQQRERQESETQDGDPNDPDPVDDPDPDDPDPDDPDPDDPDPNDPDPVDDPDPNDPDPVDDPDPDDPDPNDPGSVITAFNCVQVNANTIRLDIVVQGVPQPFTTGPITAPGITCGGAAQ
jgi:hypothetical protein